MEFTVATSFRAECSEVEKSVKDATKPVQRFLHSAADEKSVRYSRNDDRSINSSSSRVYTSFVISSGAEKSFKNATKPVQRFLHFAADEKSARYSRNDDRSIILSSIGIYIIPVISSGAQRSREIFRVATKPCSKISPFRGQ
ncbi:hypothetical protein [Pedobacter jeongneungensis]|uniref:hypothetical protein n=1 Tax=Pedobacter jeongneungensis TaxID=947309 RepID=UPI0013B398DC|nr:hypothetical protein [Pedobacter jeongneungensis]